MRRGGVGVARRGGGFRGIGAGGAAILDLSNPALGTFTRSTEGSRLTGAPTDGSTPFMVWDGVNVRRIEDRGDGLGAMLLMEGSRTNLVTDSRACTGTGWTAAGIGSPTVTLNAGTGPDGTSLADRVQAASAGAGPYQTVVDAGTHYRSQTIWAKRMGGGGGGTAQMSIAPGQDDQTAINANAWIRCDNIFSGGANPTHVPWEGRGLYGGAAQALDYLADLHQLEAAAFPSSAIRTVATTVTRGADQLSYPTGSYPSTFPTRGFSFTHAPDMSSAEMVASTQGETLFSFSGGAGLDRLMLSFTGGNCAVYIFDSDTFPAGQACTTITWARGTLLTITVNPAAGTVTVSGALTGNGTTTITPWAWPVGGTLYVGNAIGGAATMFGRMGLSVRAL